MKQRKQTKRQLLNALLDAEEAQHKINASISRLWTREEKLNEKREKLSEQLNDVLCKERKKSGEKDEPIIYKNHMFDVCGKTWQHDASCDIKAIKSVK